MLLRWNGVIVPGTIILESRDEIPARRLPCHSDVTGSELPVGPPPLHQHRDPEPPITSDWVKARMPVDYGGG